MVDKVSELTPPTGIKRLLFRAPIWLYKLHLGWLLGNRMLKLTHQGRVSGEPREVVLEVVRYDPASDSFTVAAAWGEKSDWVKNIRVNPSVRVQAGHREMNMQAAQLTPEQGEQAILEYAQKHPTAMNNIASYMGYQLDGSQADYRDLGRKLLMFSFTPQTQGHPS